VLLRRIENQTWQIIQIFICQPNGLLCRVLDIPTPLPELPVEDFTMLIGYQNELFIALDIRVISKSLTSEKYYCKHGHLES
jgi:hypothetical protein